MGIFTEAKVRNVVAKIEQWLVLADDPDIDGTRNTLVPPVGTGTNAETEATPGNAPVTNMVRIPIRQNFGTPVDAEVFEQGTSTYVPRQQVSSDVRNSPNASQPSPRSETIP